MQSDSQLFTNESGTSWSTSSESDSHQSQNQINLCKEADSGSTSSTHEDCEKNEAFICEEQLACTNNTMSKEAYECGKNMASTEEKIEAHEECEKNMASTEEKTDCTDNGPSAQEKTDNVASAEEKNDNVASAEEKTDCTDNVASAQEKTDNVASAEEKTDCTDNVLVLSKDSHEDHGKNIASNEEELDCTENVLVVSCEAHEDRGKNIAFPEDKPDCTESHEECRANNVTNEGGPNCTQSEHTSITQEDQAITTTQAGTRLKNEVTSTVQEELTMTTATVHIQESNKNECIGIGDDDRAIKIARSTSIQEMSDNLSIDSTFVDLCTSIAVAENIVALSSLPPVQGARASTPVSDASDDEVPLSQLIPKGFKIKKNVKSEKYRTSIKRITRSATTPSSS